MNTKKVEIGGKELKVGFGMGVAIDWERLSGRSFNVGESLSDVGGQVMLCYAALKRCNKSVALPEFDEWVDGLSAEDNVRLQSAVAECLEEFYRLPGAVAEDGAKEKNA